MIDAIIFNTNTGHVRKYALVLAERLSLPAYTIKEAKRKLPRGSNIIYMSWVCQNKLVNFSKMVNYNVLFSIAVGISPYNLAYIDLIKKESILYGKLFYLRGGIDTKRLGFINYLTLRSIKEELSFKLLNKNASEEEIDILDIILHNKNLVNYDDLIQIIDYVKKEYNSDDFIA